MTEKVQHPSVDERKALGKGARSQVAPDGHRDWTPAADRPDPVALLEEQNATREPDLVPVRHGRMMVSPFTFYRGAAKIMAADLKDTPTAGLDVQLCGDAHLSNFGVYASPERTLVFDLNDFDETLPGPFEYDVKRMAASFTIAARNNGFAKSDARDATRTSVTAYRTAMAEFAEMPTMDIWYARLSEAGLVARDRHRGASIEGRTRRAGEAGEEGTSTRSPPRRAPATACEALSKLAELVDGQYRIVSQPPIVVPLRDRPSRGMSADQIEQTIHEQFRAYRATLQDDRAAPARAVRAGRRGSQGRRRRQRRHRAFIVLLQGRDQQDPLFLQVKEATASVLEDHLPKSRYSPGRASASCRDSGSCRRPATSSSAGRRASGRTATCTGASCAT